MKKTITLIAIFWTLFHCAETGYGQVCTENVNCPPYAAWAKEKNAVVVVGYINDNDPDDYCSCTGTLINNIAQDGTWYVLTAGHCINSPTEAASAFIKWNFEEECNGDNLQEYDSPIGSLELTAWSLNLDFSLLKLLVPPPTEVQYSYAGWDASTNTPQNLTIIHHPNPDEDIPLRKRISWDNQSPVSTSASFPSSDCVEGYSPPSNSEWKFTLDDGWVATGSSGAAVFNENHRIVGTNSSAANAPNILCLDFREDVWAQKFSWEWDYLSNPNNQLKHWLDPLVNGVRSNVLKMDGYDPNDAQWTADNSYEPNNTQAASEVLFKTLGNQTASGFLRSYIQSTSDNDYYKFNFSHAGRLSYVLEVPAGQTYSFQITDAAGNVLSTAAVDEVNIEQLSPPYSAVFFIKIAASGTSSNTQRYKFSFDWEPCSDNYEPNHSASTSTNLFPVLDNTAVTPPPVHSYIASASDNDWHRFNINQPGTLTVNLQDLPHNYNLLLRKATGSPLAQSLNPGTQDEQLIYQVNTAPVVLYAVIYSADGAASLCDSYELSIDWQPAGSCSGLVLSTQSIPASTATSQDGSILLNVTGGQPPFSFEWSNGQTSQDLTNVATGYYSVVVTDADDCTKTASDFVDVEQSGGGGNTNLIAYEYWFDDDDDDRQQIYFTPVAVKLLTASFNADDLADGVHRFHIRFLDENDNWSSVLSQFFVKRAPVLPGNPDNTVEEYEYWFDDDYASAISGTIPAGQTVEFDEEISEASQLANGVHRFHIRFKDYAGNWSSVLSQFFVKRPPAPPGTPNNTVEQYEYWFDDDYASAISGTVPAGQTVEFDEEISEASQLANGVHRFHIRFKDEAGNWSSVLSQFFVKRPLAPPGLTNNVVVKYRYWFDQANSVMVTTDLPSPVSPYLLIQSICTDNLTVGDHTVHFQFQDSLQNWSSVTTDTFSKSTPVIACTHLTSPVNGVTNVLVTSALSWEPNCSPPALGYRLNIGTTSGGTDILNNFDVGNVTTYNPPGDFPYNATIYVKITPYFVSGDAMGCTEESFSTPVCIPNLTIANMTVPSGTYQSQGTLTSYNATVASGVFVVYTSDASILLQPNFTVELGGDFRAFIQACPVNFSIVLPEGR